ncbi:hypothetical protein D3C72_1180840 [compost metagenome]
MVQGHGMQQIQQLALVLVNTLDLHIEHRFGVDRNAYSLLDQTGQSPLAVQSLLGKLLAERCLVGKGIKVAQAPLRVVQHVLTQGLDQHAGQLRVRLIQPATEGDAVGLVVDPLGIELMQLGKHGTAHQLGVQCRHAIDAVRAQKRQIAHTDTPAVVFLDQRHRTQHIEIMNAFGPQGVDVKGIDQVDDLHVPRQHALHQADRPGFQGLGQQGVVGISQGVDGQVPSGIPRHFVLIDEQAHQLGHGNRWVGIVKLDRCRLMQVEQAVMYVQVAAEQILQRGADKKVLLAQAQLLTGLSAVSRVQHPRDTLGARHFGHGAQVVARIEALQV